MSYYCRINLQVWSQTLVFSHKHHKTSPRVPPQITYAAFETTQFECVLPFGTMPLPEGDKADTSGVWRDTAETPCARGSAWVS